ncbi:hypothetical protein PR048_006920 [Dryococelus australis]|uniref:Uncharacterized protein n=1 Tax=Dryococelus australis TaxID=614101 RepID=A0ABQ9ICB5_9NEOP|nr:hypothetical protein PR048_006920 [Dryococelus australis]
MRIFVEVNGCSAAALAVIVPHLVLNEDFQPQPGVVHLVTDHKQGEAIGQVGQDLLHHCTGCDKAVGRNSVGTTLDSPPRCIHRNGGSESSCGENKQRRKHCTPLDAHNLLLRKTLTWMILCMVCWTCTGVPFSVFWTEGEDCSRSQTPSAQQQ